VPWNTSINGYTVPLPFTFTLQTLANNDMANKQSKLIKVQYMPVLQYFGSACPNEQEMLQ